MNFHNKFASRPYKKRRRGIFAVVLLVLILIGGGFYAFRGKKPNTNSSVIDTNNTVRSTVNEEIKTIAAKSIKNVVVDEAKLSGYKKSGPATNNGVTNLGFNKSNPQTFKTSNVSFVWGNVSDKYSGSNESKQITTQFKKQFPKAKVSIVSSTALSIKGTDSKTYVLPCSSVAASLGKGLPATFQKICTVKLNDGKQFLQIKASGISATDSSTILDIFASSTTLYFD